MSSTGKTTSEKTVSLEARTHAQDLKLKLGQMRASLIVMEGKLRHLNEIASSASWFIDPSETTNQLVELKKTFKEINELEFDIRLFVEGEKAVTIVIAGGYSSGKSTLINGLLGIDLLVIDDAPASKKVVNIRYGSVEAYHLLSSSVDEKDKTTRKKVSRDELKNLQLTDEGESTFDEIEICLDYDILKSITLIDTPGLDAVSGKGGDTLGTIRVMKKRADVLFWVADVVKGSLPNKDVTELKKVAGFIDHPLVILNKMDNHSPQERKNIEKGVRKQLDSIFGRERYNLFPYSAKLVYQNRPARVKRREAIQQLVKDFSGALENGSYSLNSTEAGNSVLIAGFQGPVINNINASVESDSKKKTTEPGLLKQKSKVLDTLNSIIKDRPSLMLRHSQKSLELSERASKFEKSITSLQKRLATKSSTQKKHIIGKVFNRAHSQFKSNFKREYADLNEQIVKEYIRKCFQTEVLQKGSFWKNYKSEIRINFNYDSSVLVKRKVKIIMAFAKKITDVFASYGVTNSEYEMFSKNIKIMIELTVQEALSDFSDYTSKHRSLVNHKDYKEFSKVFSILHKKENNGDKKRIVFVVDDEEKEKKIILYLTWLYKLLIDNEIVWNYCERSFLQNIEHAIDSYFKTINSDFINT